MKNIFLFIFLLSSLEARVNPFFPPKENGHPLVVTTNSPQQYEQLKQATISLPSSARLLKEVSVEYINVDGSTERKSIAIDKNIDWHLPIVVSQTTNNAVATSVQTTKKESKVQREDKELVNYNFVSFLIQGKKITITTKDKSIRNFLIANPYRIVVDFKSDYKFKSFVKLFANGVAKSIKVGNHNDFYRVVIELDGQYKYNFSQDVNGCNIVLD